MKIRRIAAADIRPGMKVRAAGTPFGPWSTWREVTAHNRAPYRSVRIQLADGTDELRRTDAEFEVLEEGPYLLAAVDNRPLAEAVAAPIFAAGLLALLGFTATPRIA